MKKRKTVINRDAPAGVLIDGKYTLTELLDMEKLEYFFNLFTMSTGFTASLVLFPEHNLLIKSGCRNICGDLRCIDPESGRSCITEDLLLDSEVTELNDLTMRISSIGLADGALPVVVHGIHAATIISGHVFFDKPDTEKLIRSAKGSNLEEFLTMVGGIENIPVVTEDVLKASLFMLRDMTTLLAEQRLNRLAEEEAGRNLLESERLFRGITGSLPGVVFRFYARPGGEMGLYYVSGRSMEILGVDSTPSGFLERIYQFILPEDQGPFMASINDAVAGFRRWDHEARIKTPSGEEKYIRGISEPEHYGDEIIFNGVLLDITAEKRTEKSLKESEARYREIFDDATVGIYQSLPEGRYRLVNRTLALMAGYESPEQMVEEVDNIALQLFVNPADREELKKLLEDPGFVSNRVLEFKRKDGTRVWCTLNAVSVKNDSGDVLYYHGTLIDITEKKKAEDALKLSEERYRQITAFTGQLIYDLDINNSSIQWAGRSDGFPGFSETALKNFSMEEWRGRIHPEDAGRVSTEINLARREHTGFTVEYRFEKEPGEYLHIEEIGGFLYDETGAAARMLGVMKNISERIAASEERISLERKLLYAQKMESLGIMAGGIAHDFNNLLMAIMGSVELAMLQIDHGEDVYKNLVRAMEASKRASDITGQMLAYSGKGHFVMSPVEPSALLSGMTEIIRATVNRSISVKREVPDDLPCILADPGQFQQVLMNLVTNSSEAIGERSGEIVITAGVQSIADDGDAANLEDRELKPGEYVYVEVSDNGCGMDDVTMKKLFDPFFSTKQTGRGLGLPAVQGIMKGHGGAVMFESTEGHGSTFRVLFPVVSRSRSGRGATPARKKQKKDDAVLQGLVLVVDDEDVVRDLCMEFVRISGFKPVGAENGEQGIEIFRRESESLSCVLLDLSMPKMDGVAALREMKKINPDVPVLLCSGYTEDDATRSFAGEELAGFLQKPYRLETLKERLLSVVKKESD